MSQPAAALGDPAAHGGTIATGSPNVFIGGRMAARVGDSVACPIHGIGNITRGSATVFINGMPAARMPDLTGCMVVGLPAASLPTVLGPAPAGAAPREWAGSLVPEEDGKFYAETDQAPGGVSALHAEGHLTDADHDGTYDTVSGAAGLLRVRNEGALSPPSIDLPLFGPTEVYGTHAEDIGYANAQASANVTHYGGSTSGSVEAGLSKSSGSISFAPVGDKGKNAYLSVAQEVNLMHAKAEEDVLVGSDGTRTGVGGGFSYGAEALSEETALLVTTPSIMEMNEQVIFKKSESLSPMPGSSEGGGVWAYYDKAKERLFFRAKGKLSAWLGLGFELEMSAGRKFHDDPPAPEYPPGPVPAFSFLNIPGVGAGGVPGTVLFGNPTVLIG